MVKPGIGFLNPHWNRPMIPSCRYLLAFVVNVALPAAAYRVALHYTGLSGALLISMLPLLAWMCADFAYLRHFDALSALALAGLALSVLAVIFDPTQWLRVARAPVVSGAIGMLFLGSLALRRPLVFYLARSTLARERQGREVEFEQMWRTRPALIRSIRLMTAVWGAGLVTENAARLWVIYRLAIDDPRFLSSWIGVAAYTGLSAWTVLYRRYCIKRQAAPSGAT
ncbi:putative membrane protein [Caballeronia sordidicola]|uniref:Putative membrane protein n=2 Tax=Caballeronia sordidicola TaxID=196367 RepID=A0A158I8F5_CABSO|nr:putative membrane protein [Caballeronia sordidicola]